MRRGPLRGYQLLTNKIKSKGILSVQRTKSFGLRSPKAKRSKKITFISKMWLLFQITTSQNDKNQ